MFKFLFDRDRLKRYDGPFFHLDLLAYLKSKTDETRLLYFGSTSEVLERIEKKLRNSHPNLVVRTISPPFQERLDETHVAKYLKEFVEFDPKIVLVGLTAPKQEIFSFYLRNHLKKDVLIGNIGAEFDFYAGTVKRHPDIVARSGFLWLYRFILQPRKIYRRVFISVPMFVLYVFKRRLL
jgi:N-acetylglucosaminyldiphosphoundecaprenol N-acetyl-beta-D-mannosaminyltransferase